MLDPMKMLPDERPPENLLDDIIPSAMDASDTNMMQMQQQLQVSRWRVSHEIPYVLYILQGIPC